jgi:hypothetical protein
MRCGGGGSGGRFRTIQGNDANRMFLHMR